MMSGLACGHCGSGNVTKVEPDTYFCHHCKQLFKYHDPTRITVNHQPSFCSCGNPVEFQCQVCKNPMCWECDVIAWQERYRKDNFGAAPCITVPVRGFGYLRKAGRSGEEWSIVGTRIVKAKVSASVIIGPFLHVDDIIPQMAEVKDGLRHLCRSCLTGAVPATAEAIATGIICETPGCGVATTGRCRCCRSAFCTDHLAPAAGADPRRTPPASPFRARHIVTIAWGNGGHWDVREESVEYYGPQPRGLCGMCALERAAEAEREVIAICDRYSGIYRAQARVINRSYPVNLYEVPIRKMPAGFLQGAENKRAMAIATGCGDMINNKIRTLQQLPGACRRDQWFASFPVGGMPESSAGAARAQGANSRLDNYLEGPRLGRFLYAVLDERGQTDPAANVESVAP